MKFFGKPIAVSLTAVLLAANLSMPFTSMTAFGADTDSAVESTAESAENAYAEEVINENDSEAEAENSPDEDYDRSSADAEEIAEPAESAAPGDEETAADEMTSDETSEDEMYADEDSADGSAYEDISAENGGDAVSAEDVSDDNTASDDSSEEPDQDITAPALTEETSTDAVDAGQDVPEDHPDLEAEAVAEPIIPIDEICEDTDNDDVFAAYVNRELELTGDMQFDTGDLSDTSNNHEKAYASTKLTGVNRALYAKLYSEIGKVARGERTDTVFAVTQKELGINDQYWSASDLGVSAIVENGSITSESMKALSAKYDFDFTHVLRALLLDCPYDLYWYDKTESTIPSLFHYGATWMDGEYYIYYSDAYDATFSFPVAAEYSASGDLNTYETNAEIGTAVTTAYNKAHSIVEQYSGCSDYEKMDGYRAEICSLASYNYDAARDNSTNYGNPWQLIWVLDQDPGTTVVCEGYSKAFQYLCDLSEWNDIFRECISVVGYLSGGGHMWNIVNLRDGRSYLVDVTNCDSGMIGSDNDGHDLFLVGTGDADAAEVYCQGNIDDGYIFAQLDDLSYVYREDQKYNTREYFDDEILTLAEGRVYADTTASGEYTGDHTHIYYNVDEVAATCQSEGHSAGGQCPICGEYDTDVEIYPAAGHTPGEWTLTKEPTYDAEGTETATCTVCGEEMTRPVDKLVSETSITLDYQELELDGNESKQLTATVLPENAHDKSVTWRSSNTSVAAVDQTGRVTARTNGTTIITAQSAHLGLTASCTVTVRVHVQSIHVNPQGTQVAVGGTTQLYVDINPSNALNKKYTWSSSDESIATISSSGLVKGIAPGEAMITATTQDGGLTSSCRVNVYIPVTGVALEPASLTMALNEERVLTPTIIPADASNPAVTWTSSNNSVVMVRPDGSVHARSVGTAKITVTTRAGGFKASCTITVVIPVESIELDHSELYLEPGETEALNATVLPDNATNKTVTWSSSDEDVASVGSDGSVTAVADGTATITATAEDGGLTASCTVTVKTPAAEPTDLAGAVADGTAQVSIEDGLIYNGTAQVPQVTITYQGEPLKAGADFSVTCSDNINAGTATAVINGKGEYTGSFTRTFTIAQASIQSAQMGNLSVRRYTGDAHTPEPVLKIGSTTLTKGTDYTLTYENNINAGMATVIATGKGNYKDSTRRTFVITPTVITNTTVSSVKDVIYTGAEQKPSVTITFNGRTLTAGTDYTLGYSNNVNAGKGVITITGRGNFTGSGTINFTIKPSPIDEASLSSIKDQTYNGSALEPDVTVTLDGKTLTADTDYTVAYADNIEPGTAKLTITGSGNYTGTATGTFKIVPIPIANAEVSGLANKTYNGSEQTQTPVVKLDGSTLTAGTDYTVSYSNNINAGTATVTITGTGHYEGTASADFTIAKAAQSFTVKAESTSIDVGKTTKVTATGAKETSKYTFSSSDTSIAEVDASGTVTGKAEGTVTITVRTAATANYKAGSKTVKITVNEPQTINLEDNAVISGLTNRTYNGSEQFQTPVVKLKDGTVLKEGTDYTVSYENNRNAGTATVIITAADGSKYEGTASAAFDIAKAAQSFTVKASATSIDAGKTTKVAATGAKEKPKFTFTSSNAKVATVDAAGTVTGKAAGTVTIPVRSAETANYKAASKTIRITVNKVLKKPGNCHFVKWNNAKYTSCRIGWVKVDGAEGYETLLSWTDGSHASRTITKSNVLYRDCTVHPQHVSQMMVRAFYTLNGIRKYSPWSNVEYITPSPTKLTVKNTSSGTNLKMNISWNIIYGCNGYNVFLTTNPNGTWYWNQSTSTTANSTSAVINKYRGSKLKKNVRYYVRIVTRRQRNGVFCTVPMPAANTYIGSFIIK